MLKRRKLGKLITLILCLLTALIPAAVLAENRGGGCSFKAPVLQLILI